MKKIFLLFLLLTIHTYSQDFKIFSHRGGAALGPENTLAACSKGIEAGAHYFEIDVQMTSDDSLVIMHDGTIDRTTDGSGSVRSLTFAQIRAVDAGSWFGAEFAGEQVPTLNEVLELALDAAYEVGVIIEIKSTEVNIVDKVVALVQEKNMQNRVVISSFTFSQLTKSKSIDPTIPVQVFASPVTITMLNNLAAIGAEWAGTGSNLAPEILDSAHVKNIKVNRWTVNSASDIKNLVGLGYDAVTTDNPIVALAAMDSTGPSTVVLNNTEILSTKVKLTWQEASDPESGISYYELYRSKSADASDLIAKVYGTTYIDETLEEEETFYYRVKAVNFAGLLSDNFSNEVVAVTEADEKAPKVRNISAYGISNKIIVEFNERLEKVSAETITNYGVSDGITVNQAVLSVDSMSVILITSDMTSETEYTLSLVNITDLAANPNSISDTLFFNFTYNSYLSDLVGAWDFDEATGTTLFDYSNNLNNASAMNGLGFGTGFTGNGLVFDGIDDYAQIPASTSLDINTEAVTISLWTKLAYLPADLPTSYGPLYDSETDQYVLYEDKGNNELRFKVSTSASAERPGIPAANLSVGKWIHIVGVYDGANAMVYLDGVLMDSHPLTGTVKSGQVATIGKSGTSYFEGSMDNIQVFAKALTQEEINFLHTEFIHTFIDTTPPEIGSVSSNGANNKLFINFSEELDQLNAETSDNYKIDNGITVNSAQLTVDGKTVILTTSELSENKIYTLTVNDVKDLADIPNSILENTEVTFVHKSFPDGLISYWSFDEGEDTLANDWTGTNTAFIKNAPEWIAGYTGNALKFDAVDDLVEVPNSTSLDIDTNGVTVSAWVMLNKLPSEMAYPYGPIYDSGTDNYVIYEDKGNNELRFKVATTNGAERPGIPADTLVKGQWIHVAGVYDGAHAKIYLNGQLMDTHNLTGNVKPGQVAHIGQDGTSYFDGNIDNVQVYNKGLSEQEVKFLYSGIKTPTLSVASVDETIVTLAWNDVHDPLLGISGYKVYRDTTAAPEKLIAFVKEGTSYVDQTRHEFAKFYYRIIAVDAGGNLAPYYSNDVEATTEADQTAPQITSVRTTGEQGKVYVNFDEILDETAASELSNYSIHNLTISSVELSSNRKNVTLTTSDMEPGSSYVITLKNIKDASLAQNVITENTQVNFNYNALYDGLISYWKLDEVDDTTAVDLMGINNGKIANSPMSTDGIFGNALFFDGVDDWVEIPNSTSLDLNTEGVTVSVWLNLMYLPTEMPTGIGPIYDAPQDCYVMYEDRGNKELRFKVSTVNGAERPGIPEAELTKGEWINVVGVYDGTQALIYLNGVQKDSHPGLTGAVKPGQVARIGQDGTHYFNGAIDNVQIYNRALSLEEVTALYNGDLVTDVEEVSNIPTEYSLSQNYPNPFNPSTKIRFALPQKADVSLEIFNIIGERVDQLVSGTMNPGIHEVEFKNSKLSSGIYFYRLKTGNFVEVKKMMLLK